MTHASRGLVVRGVRTHNLQGFDVEIPHEALVVVTGPSGSGKSSLAFATVHAESVRRILSASRSTDADAAALARMPDVESIDGLGATLALSQRGVVRSPRTTVATLAGIAAPLRRLFGAFARPACPVCGGDTERHEVGRVVEAISSTREGTRIMVLAKVADGVLGDGRATLATLARAGFVRARIDGQIVAIADAPPLAPRAPHVIEALVDRIVFRPSELDRLREAVELAYRTAGDTVTLAIEGEPDRGFSRLPRCTACGSRADLLPRDAFRVDSPAGCCTRCSGKGYLEADSPSPKRRGRAPRAADEDDERAAPSAAECPDCEGLGLLPASLGARVAGHSFRDVALRPVAELVGFGADVLERVAGARSLEPTIVGLASVAAFLVDVGLGHLALARRAPTLSNGELARVRLSGLLANELTGLVYVLDEPTAGLHPSERPAILRAMRRLVERGNTVLCVEHDADVARASDHVIELGEGAGPAGGRLIASGPPGALPQGCLTRALLDGRLSLPARRPREASSFLGLRGLRVGPFSDVDLRLPRACLTVLSGVSGSGKTTLLRALASVHASALAGTADPLLTRGSEGFEAIARAVRLDDVTSVSGPRALVATRLGLFKPIRELFAGLPEARAKGFDAARFALHAEGGRCEECAGTGKATVQGQAADVDAPCERCEGRRYDAATLAIRYRGLSIADVLEGTVVESIARFEAMPSLHEPLSQARRLGLEHLQLGRPARELSGGESQRLRLAAELSGKAPARSLYLLDEPSRGLHAVDVRRLVHALDELVDAGATVVVADHSLEVIASADFVLDLGVDAERRSFVVDSGTPAELAARLRGPTAEALRGRLSIGE